MKKMETILSLLSNLSACIAPLHLSPEKQLLILAAFGLCLIIGLRLPNNAQPELKPASVAAASAKKKKAKSRKRGKRAKN